MTEAEITLQTNGLCLKSFAGMTTGNRNNIEVAEITTENGNNIEDCRDASTPYVVIPAKAGILNEFQPFFCLCQTGRNAIIIVIPAQALPAAGRGNVSSKPLDSGLRRNDDERARTYH